MRVTSSLNTKKERGMIKILNGKSRVQEGLDLNQKVLMSASNKNVINVDNKGQKGVTIELYKEAVIMRGLPEAKSKELGAKLRVPLARSLFEDVKRVA